jgi:hypothetical protein
MKYLKLYEQFRLILEATGTRCVLVDGTSSAGKSYMTKGLKDKGWIILGSDEYFDIEMRIPFDHEGKGYDKEAGEEWHKQMPELRKKDDKEMQERGATTIAWPGHPKHEQFKKVNDTIEPHKQDHRTWYMYQDYLYGRGKNSKGVIFDDISDNILKYVPDCEYILLYAPLDRLKDNVIGRAEKKDKRGGWVFSDQFLKRFEATESEKESRESMDPEEKKVPEGPYTKKSLKELLEDEVLQNAFNEGEKLDVDKFISDLGVKEDDKKYFIKLRKPLKKGQRLFNSRNKTPKNLETFIG